MDDLQIELVTTRYGKLAVPVRDAVIGHSLRTYGEWAEHEVQSISNHLADGKTVIDVGANLGAHCIAYSARFPRSRVYAFEPQPRIYNILAANVVFNNYRNITPLLAACSEQSGFVNLDVDYSAFDWNCGSVNILSSAAQGSRRVPVAIVRLDELSFEGDIQFIKIDVEGMELEVLRGAINLISIHRPLIYLECNSIEKLRSFMDFFGPHGFKMFWHETSAFNLNNFRSCISNVWSRCELGIIACPLERSGEFSLPAVSGFEREAPIFHEPTFGFAGDHFQTALSDDPQDYA